jgi:small conductance mechanosensitive channel
MEKWFDLVKEKLAGWLTGFIRLLPNLVLVVIIFGLFIVAAKYLRRFFNRLLLRISHKESISSLFSNILYLVILFAGLFVSLQLLHLDKTIASLLAGAGIIGLALGFAFQDLTANFISGVFIIFRKPFDVGHIIDTSGFIGEVEEIQLRSTTIRTYQGLHVMLPNKEIFQKAITNYSLSGQRRIDISLTVSAKINIEQLEETVRNTLREMGGANVQQKAEVYFTDYTGDNIKMEAWYWIDNAAHGGYINTRHKVIKAVHAAVARLQQP